LPEQKLDAQALEIIGLARHSSKKCVCFFSGGKDSVVLLSLLQKVYKKPDIHLVFMPFVDGLKETEIVTGMAARLGFELNLYQHWSYFVDKAGGHYCPPEGTPKKLFDVYAEVREDFGQDLPIFYGAKRSDGLWRRFNTLNSNNKSRGVYAPIYEWSKYDVLSYIRKNKLEYIKAEGDRVSGVDLSAKYLLWAYEHQPQSYEAMKREFPFIDVVIAREKFFRGGTENGGQNKKSA